MPDPTLFGPENATPSDQQEFMQSDEQRLGMEQSFRHEFLDLEKHFGTRTNIYDLLEQAYNDGEIKPLNAEMYPDQPQDIRLQVAIKSVRPAIEDIEACCRHALSIDADNIIFLDKSARLHGALVHRIMPIMRLEYCKMNSIPLDRAKIPNIMFMSPVPSSTTEETLGSSSEEFLRVYGDKLEDKVTLIFDESTKSDTPYDYSKFTSEDQYQQFSNGSSHDSDRNFSVNRLSSIRKRVAKAILQTVPNVVIEAHAGNAG